MHTTEVPNIPKDFVFPPKLEDTPPAKKKPTVTNSRSLSQEDAERVAVALSEIQETETQSKIKKIAANGKDLTKALLFDTGPDVDLRSVHACMTIVKRWQPQIDEEGNFLGDQEGNLENPDALDKDTVHLAALSFTVSIIKGQLDSATAAAETDLKFIEARLRNQIRKEKRKQSFSGSPTETELKDTVITHETYREACELHAACRELAAIVEACYFASKRLEDRLNNRVRCLVSRWARTTK